MKFAPSRSGLAYLSRRDLADHVVLRWYYLRLALMRAASAMWDFECGTPSAGPQRWTSNARINGFCEQVLHLLGCGTSPMGRRPESFEAAWLILRIRSLIVGADTPGAIKVGQGYALCSSSHAPIPYSKEQQITFRPSCTGRHPSTELSEDHHPLVLLCPVSVSNSKSASPL